MLKATGVFAAAALGGALPAAAETLQQATDIPDIPQALLNAAYETEDPEEIAAVAKAVKAVFPDYAAAIERQSAAQIAMFSPTPETKEETEPQDEAIGGVFAVKPWDGKIQAGASFASGNSDNVAAGLSIDAARTAGPWVHNVKAYVDIAEADGVTSQERWGASYKLDYAFSERTYVYGRFSYDQDEFSGFDYRLFAGAGLGHFFFKSEPFKLKLEGGPGYRYSPIELSDAIEEEVALFAASEADWVVREGVIFEQDVNVTWTSPTTTLQSISALRTELTDAISTAISFEYRYETNPPAGRQNTDTIARASLVYGF